MCEYLSSAAMTSQTTVELEQSLEWMRLGTERFEGAVASLSDEDLKRDSALPGWSRAHVVSHVARNADAVGNLLRWARTGIETPMYRNAEQRAAEIESGARRQVSELRADLSTADVRLTALVDQMTNDAWRVPVRTARGRLIPATDVPWLRVREVWIHAVDLNAGSSMTEFPPELIDSLIDDVLASFAARDDIPGLRLRLSDRGGTRHTGSHRSLPVDVSGSAAEVLSWLVGRSPASTFEGRESVASLPKWL
jgi:maleylpyruvate isomerase